MIRALPDPEIGQVTVPGVDEFAKRKGQNYATILVDLDTHRPVDVLDGREAQVLADWLAAHPGVETVCPEIHNLLAQGYDQAQICQITGLNDKTVRKFQRDLDAWLTAVDTENTDLPHLRSFAHGLRRDHAAVLNGLSLPYSFGAVEGETARSSTSKDSCSVARG